MIYDLWKCIKLNYNYRNVTKIPIKNTNVWILYMINFTDTSILNVRNIFFTFKMLILVERAAILFLPEYNAVMTSQWTKQHSIKIIYQESRFNRWLFLTNVVEYSGWNYHRADTRINVNRSNPARSICHKDVHIFRLMRIFQAGSLTPRLFDDHSRMIRRALTRNHYLFN